MANKKIKQPVKIERLQADISEEAKNALTEIKKNFGIQKGKAVNDAILKYYKHLNRTRL